MHNAAATCQVKFDSDKIRFDKLSVKSNLTLLMSETGGQFLKRVRTDRGLNQTELALMARVSKNTISLLEADKIVQPRHYQLEKISKALKLPPDLLRNKFSGVQTATRPTTIAEFLEILEALGLEQFVFSADRAALENYGPEDFEELLERIKAGLILETKMGRSDTKPIHPV